MWWMEVWTRMRVVDVFGRRVWWVYVTAWSMSLEASIIIALLSCDSVPLLLIAIARCAYGEIGAVEDVVLRDDMLNMSEVGQLTSPKRFLAAES